MKRLLIVAALAALCLVPLAGGAAPATAQSGNTWNAAYFNNPDWAGNPVLTQWAPFVSFNWGFGSPGAGVPVDFFTARFTTDAFFYAGNYTFTATADDEVVLIVDGVTYLDTRNAGRSGKTFTINVPIAFQGSHRVEVWFREYTQAAYIFINWVFGSGGTPPPPPPTPTPPPANNCRPQSSTSVQTQFGDYTPCIQQNIHQKNCFQSNGAWDAPNMGSIEMEPQIQVWRNCTADSTTTFPVSCDPNVPQQSFKCSKTEAGFFPG